LAAWNRSRFAEASSVYRSTQIC